MNQISKVIYVLISVLALSLTACKSSELTTNPRMTSGEITLAPNKDFFVVDRQKAIQAIAAGEYDTAQTILEEYLQQEINPNDPEARIFLSNLLASKAKGSYTIAVTLPISSNRSGSLELLRGVAHAQWDINQARSSRQKQLKVIIVDDDDSDPNNGTAIAEEVAKDLSSNKEILGVVGPYSSGTSLATAKIYEENKLAVISPVSTSVELTNYSPYFFRTVPNDAVAAKKLAQVIKETLQPSEIAAFYNSDSKYSESLHGQFRKELIQADFDIWDDPYSDFTEWPESPESWPEVAQKVIHRAKQDGVQAIMLAPSSGYLDRAIEIALANQGELLLLGGDDVYSSRTLAEGRDSVINMIIAVAWHINSQKASDSDFAQRAKELWGTKNINWRTITSYDAVQAFMKAIDNQPRATRESIQQELSANLVTFGAVSEVKFLESGDYGGNIQLVQGVKQRGGTIVFEPYEIPK